MVSIAVEPTDDVPYPNYTVWDLINFLLFNRFLVLFDIPTFLILFIDPLTIKRPVPLLIFCHWVFRNTGAVLFGFLRYFSSLHKDPYIWRYTTGIPTLPWYIGELCLDIYPFMKAMAVAKGRRWLIALCMVGFIPLVLAKAGMIIFRYYWIFHVDSKTKYFGVQTKLDAAVLAVTAWSDLFNSIVIVYAGTETKRFRRNEFLSNLVRTTELRIVVCTVLVFVAVFFTLIDNCLSDPTAQGDCRFKGARDIAVNVVYSLYLMDYLVIKFHRVFQTEKTIRQQQKPRTILNKENTAKVPWPVFGLGRAPSLTMNQPSRSSQVYDRSQTQTDLDTPSFVILKKAAKYYPSKNSSQTFQKSQLGASSLGPSTKELSISTNPSNNNSEESLPSKSTDSPNSTSKKQQKQPIRGIERTNTHKSNKSRLSVTVAASSAVSYSDSVIEKHDEDNASSSDFSPAESVPLKSVVGMNAYQKANESGEGSSVWYEDENSTLKRQTAVPKNEPRRQVLSKLFGTNR